MAKRSAMRETNFMAILEEESAILSTPHLGRFRFVLRQTGNPFVETRMRSRVRRIWPVRVLRFVTPLLVHPKPGRGIIAHVRFKRIPTRLRDLLIIFSGGLDLW